MTYINGTNRSDLANVEMIEAAEFGPDFLTLEASKNIKKDEELILLYGDKFVLPSDAGGPGP